MTQPSFFHEVLFYDGADEFLAGTVPFIQAALDAEEPVLVAVEEAKVGLLEGELGADTPHVRFADMGELGRNPARIIPIWRDFVDRHRGHRLVRGIGEPVWAGRSAAEIDECQRHESLLNLAFSGTSEWSLLCPYDNGLLEDDVLEAARDCHPFVASRGVSSANPAYADLASPAGPFAGALPPRPAGAETVEFDRDRLHELRKIVRRGAESAGLSPPRGADLVAAVSELAANSVLYGGGGGRLSLWREPGALIAETEDSGCIVEPLTGRVPLTPTQTGGRGLWLVNQLCDLAQIRSGPEGTAVRLRMGLAAEA